MVAYRCSLKVCDWLLTGVRGAPKDGVFAHRVGVTDGHSSPGGVPNELLAHEAAPQSDVHAVGAGRFYLRLYRVFKRFSDVWGNV